MTSCGLKWNLAPLCDLIGLNDPSVFYERDYQHKPEKATSEKVRSFSSSLLSLPQTLNLPLLQYFIWGGAGVLELLECVSLLGIVVCTGSPWVCVGGGLFMGKLHSSVIALIYGPLHPHLTVRREAVEIKGSLIQTHYLSCVCARTQ